MNETAHTPWKGRNVYRSNDDGSTELLRHAIVDSNGDEVLHNVRTEAARDRIVRAVNAHDDMLAALKRIEKWFGEFPETGKFWDKEQTDPMSYAACFGSNGERDFMREIARAAISKATPPEGTRT